MKAWILHSVDDIRLETIDKPLPRRGEALLAVKACGICGSDIPRIYSTGAHNMPLIPGHELSGMVETVGDNVDSSWIGKRVGVFPLIPCRRCEQCLKGNYELCRNYDYLGSRRDGGFAEYVTVPANNLIELPQEVPFEDAAMLEPASVAVHAYRRAIKIAGNNTDITMAICGAGTIGMLLVEVLMDAGYERICVITNKESQRKRAVELGISPDRICDSHEVNPAKWLLDEFGGADCFFECVGSIESLLYGIEGTKPMGTIVTVGNPHGDENIPRDIYWKILRNQLTLTGTWNSTFEGDKSDWTYMLNRIAKGSIKPSALITHRLSIKDLERGLDIMHHKTEDYCKVMMKI